MGQAWLQSGQNSTEHHNSNHFSLYLFTGHQLWSDLVRQASIFLRLQWKTIGRENVDQKQPYVVVCNHQTGLDVLASAHVRNFI